MPRHAGATAKEPPGDGLSGRHTGRSTRAAVSPAVLAATLGAACAHAAWNSIAHAIPDKVAAFTLVSAGGLVCSVPLVILAAPPGTRCWGYLAVSAMLHVVYSGLLMLSYRLGDFSQTYPLARGHLAAGGDAARGGLRRGTARAGPVRRRGPDLRWPGEPGAGGPARGGTMTGGPCSRPLATGLAIASYTTLDGIGVRLSGSVPGYTGWLMMTQSAVIPIAALAGQRTRLLGTLRPVWHIGLLGGALSVLAYGLVLWAQTRGRARHRGRTAGIEHHPRRDHRERVLPRTVRTGAVRRRARRDPGIIAVLLPSADQPTRA